MITKTHYLFKTQPMLREEEVNALLDAQLNPFVRNLLTKEDLTPVTILPPYKPTKYDGLFCMQFEELVSLCRSLKIDVRDCRIKYHIISRISLIDKEFNLLKGSDFPPIPEQSYIDEYRLQILLSMGAPGMISPDVAINNAREALNRNSIKTPFSLGKTVIISVGEIRMKKAYHTTTCIYPVGFHSKRLFQSLLNPVEDEWYDCWIQENGDRPLFLISHGSNVITCSYDIHEVWKQFQNFFREKGVLREMDEINGEEYFGLSNQVVQFLLEIQPNCVLLADYVFCFQRPYLGHADEIMKKELELRKIEGEYKSMRNTIIKHSIQSGQLAINPSVLDNLAAIYHNLIRCNHQLQVLQAVEMKARCQTMQKINEQALLLYTQRRNQVPNESVNTAGMTNATATTETTDPSETGLKVRMKRKSKVDLATVPDYLSKPVYKTRERPVKQVSQVTTRKRKRETEEEAETKQDVIIPHTNFSTREIYYMNKHLFTIRCLALNKKLTFDYQLGYNLPINLPISPSIPQSFQFQSFSSLPVNQLNLSLSLWNFISTFSRVFQLPLIPYHAFEHALLTPSDDSLYDSIMSLVIMTCFTQLKAILLQQDKEITVAGWKPFLGRRVNHYTWPEFARILFVCKVWVDNGKDVTAIIRNFVDENRHGIDVFMIVDPMDFVLMKGSTSLREEEVDGITSPLNPIDRLHFLHSLALLKRLRHLPCCENCLEPVDIRDYPDYLQVISEPMDLHTLEQQLIKGYYIKENSFDTDLFFKHLSLLWTNLLTYNHGNTEIIEQANQLQETVVSLFHTWVEEAVENQRGPWDEATYYNQGCKLCLLSNEEMHEEEMVTCEICEASFHLSCVVPPLHETPEDGWICGLCKGYSSQERWQSETTSTKVDNSNNTFDVTIYNTAVLDQLPLKPIMSNHTGTTYKYLSLFDPYTINPIFFGYNLQPPSTDVLQMPVQARTRQLARLLSTEDPHEMNFENRLAIMMTVFDIARDLPEIRHYVEESFNAMEQLEIQKHRLITIETLKIKQIYDSMNSMVSSRSGRKKKNEVANQTESVTSHTSATTETNKQQGIWTEEEVNCLREAVKTLGEGKWKEISTTYQSELSQYSPAALRTKWYELNGKQNQYSLSSLLPVTFGKITILSLGTIKPAPGFASKHMIWPVGFKSYRLFPSILNSQTNIPYYSEIIDNGVEPSFHVYSEEGIDIKRRSCSAAWIEALVQIQQHVSTFVIDSQINGIEYFGLTIEEVSQAIHQLPGAAFFNVPPSGPSPAAIHVSNAMTVLQSQWHPACTGYFMDETTTTIDPTIINPIFSHHSQDTCSYCYYCHMPETLESPLITCKVPDVDKSVAHYHHHIEKVLQKNPTSFQLEENDTTDNYDGSDDETDMKIESTENNIESFTACFHEPCMSLHNHYLSDRIKSLKKQEMDNITNRITMTLNSASHELSISNEPIGFDHTGNEYYIFRSESTTLYIHSSQNQWYCINNQQQLSSFLQTLDLTHENDLFLYTVLQNKQFKEEESVSESASKSVLNSASNTTSDPASKSISNTTSNSASNPTSEPFQLPSLPSVQAVQFFPMRALSVLPYFVPSLFHQASPSSSIEYSYCHECGCILNTFTKHCTLCHLDYDPSFYPNHQCHPLPPTSLLLQQAKHFLLLLELSLSFSAMTKRARSLWTNAKRSIWELKVRRAQTVYDLMTCLFIYEKNLAKGGLARWYKNSLCSIEAQSNIRSMSSFFVRLFVLDDAIRYYAAPSDLNQELSPMEVEKNEEIGSSRSKGNETKSNSSNSSKSKSKSKKQSTSKSTSETKASKKKEKTEKKADVRKTKKAQGKKQGKKESSDSDLFEKEI